MSLFSQPTQGSLFGGASQPAQAQPSAGGGLFGGQSTTTQQPQGGSGGTGGLFSGNAAKPATGGLFGSTTNQQASASTFSQQQPQAQPNAGGGGLFGSSSLASTSTATSQPAGGLFGQANKGGGLFGGSTATPTSQPASGAGLFGGTSKPGGLFGSSQPQQAQTPAVGGIFSQPQQPAQQQPQQQQPGSSLFPAAGQPQIAQTPALPTAGVQPGTLQQQPGGAQVTANSLANSYYNIKRVWTAEMIQRYSESQMANSAASVQMQTSLSTKNTWLTRILKEHPNFQDLSSVAKTIDDHLNTQKKDLGDLKKSINLGQEKINTVEEKIDSTLKELSTLNDSMQSVGLRIQTLQGEVHQLQLYREQLGQAISYYQASTDEYYNKVELPSPFFIDLQFQHEKVLGQIELQIREAESIAAALLESSLQHASTSLEEEKKRKDLKSMKVKVFEVCQLLYDQQKKAASQLAEIESRVHQLRALFTSVMLNQKGYWSSKEQVDELFSHEANQSSLINKEIVKKIKELKARNIAAKLEDQLKSLNISTTPAKAKKAPTTIKEKLEKGLYAQMTNKQDQPQGGLFGSLGKRPTPATKQDPLKEDKASAFTYFKSNEGEGAKRARVAQRPFSEVFNGKNKGFGDGPLNYSPHVPIV